MSEIKHLIVGVGLKGWVTNIKNWKDGRLFRSLIQYDDGDEEDCYWSDEDIVIVGGK